MISYHHTQPCSFVLYSPVKVCFEFCHWRMLGSKELGTNVLELHFVMLTNHDQNVLVLFRLVQTCSKYALLCKVGIKLLQDLLCKFAWLDRSRIRLDRLKVMQIVFFCRISNSTQARLTCRVLCFVLRIQGKTLATFLCCSSCCMCESFVRSRGCCLHTYLGFSRFKIMSRTW